MVFEGKSKASEIEAGLRKRVRRLGRKPVLVILWVGEGEASRKYVEKKREAGERIGAEVWTERVEVDGLEKRLRELSREERVDGLMVQLPVPGVDRGEVRRLLDLIPVDKDVDGLNGENLRLVMIGEEKFLPATVRAVGKIMDQAIGEVGLDIERMRVAVVGSEGAVGKPLTVQLKRFGFEVGEFDLGDKLVLEDYDVVISATGQAGLIRGEMVKEGVVAIDVGYPDGDFEERVREKAGFITPVPGGVGPVTVACLLENLVMAAEDMWEEE